MDLALVTSTDAANPTSGDLRLTDGQLTLVEGDEAIAQHLRVRLRWIRGEWFLDQRTGIPFFEDVLTRFQRGRAEALFRRTILQTPGVTALRSFRLEVSTATRRATLSFEATAESGAALVFRDFVLEVG